MEKAAMIEGSVASKMFMPFFISTAAVSVAQVELRTKAVLPKIGVLVCLYYESTSRHGL